MIGQPLFIVLVVNVVFFLLGIASGYLVSYIKLKQSFINIQAEFIALQNVNGQINTELASIKIEIFELRAQIQREADSNRHVRANVLQAVTLLRETSSPGFVT